MPRGWVCSADTGGSGETTAIIGSTGSGKSTLLRLLSPVLLPDAGEALVLGHSTASEASAITGRIGYMSQRFSMYPDLTVAENLDFFATVRGVPKQVRRERSAALLDSMGLAEFGGRQARHLSGGMKQKLMLATTLMHEPELLLLDEPFSNLDVGLRERLSLEVREILKREGSTAILVTHDQNEAFAIADEIGVMYGGLIQQWDTPYNLYHRPANRFVADFIGQGVLLPGTVAAGTHVETELGNLVSDIPVACSETCTDCHDGCAVDVLLRPDDIVHDDRSPLQAEVVHKAFRGADILYTLRLESGAQVLSLVPSHHNHALGEKIGIRLDADHVIAFKRAAR